MSDGYKILTEIPRLVVERLRADSFFSDVPIIAEDVGADFNQFIEDRIEIEIGKIGLAAIVAPVSANASLENASGIYYERIPVIVRWVEVPAVNRSATGRGLLAPWCVVRTNMLLNNFLLPGLANIFVDDPPWVRVPDPERIIYDCNHWTHAGAVDA